MRLTDRLASQIKDKSLEEQKNIIYKWVYKGYISYRDFQDWAKYILRKEIHGR
jgi:hypothetical protein